jgi:hypothetical protein
MRVVASHTPARTRRDVATLTCTYAADGQHFILQRLQSTHLNKRDQAQAVEYAPFFQIFVYIRVCEERFSQRESHKRLGDPCERLLPHSTKTGEVSTCLRTPMQCTWITKL